MESYTIITSGGRKTKTTGYLAEVIEAQKSRRTAVGIYIGTLLIATVCEGVVTFAI